MFIRTYDFSTLYTILPHDKAKKKSTLVSGNAGDEKNLLLGGHNFIFLINLTEFFK